MPLPAIDVVTTHAKESLPWARHVLGDSTQTFLFIYECGIGRQLPDAVVRHPRVVLRNKTGVLARRNHFYSFFDHVVRSYEGPARATHTLFLHGHETAYHRLTPVRTILRQCYALLTLRPQTGYVNVGDTPS